MMLVEELGTILRWLHVFLALGWFGEVFFLTHLLMPSMAKLTEATRRELVLTLFPKVFRMATLLSSSTIVTGATTAILYSNFDLILFVDSRWGVSILVGALVGITVFTLHLIGEAVGFRKLKEGKPEGSPAIWASMERRLKLLPRISFTLLTVALIFMIYASHGP